MYFHLVNFDKKLTLIIQGFKTIYHSMFIVETCFLLKMNTIQIYSVKFSVCFFLMHTIVDFVSLKIHFQYF